MVQLHFLRYIYVVDPLVGNETEVWDSLWNQILFRRCFAVRSNDVGSYKRVLDKSEHVLQLGVELESAGTVLEKVIRYSFDFVLVF